jgi:hypothetical protein
LQGSNRNLQQNKKEKPMPYWVKCVLIGFWGGLTMSAMGYIAYLLNFSAYGPALVLSPWALGDWTNETASQIVGIFALALLSILAALVYKVLLAQWYSMWVGVAYGIVIWFVVFYVFNPMFPKLEPLGDLDQNTLVTTFCIYLLYGLFIGYSVCFEYHELNSPSHEDGNQQNHGKQANKREA